MGRLVTVGSGTARPVREAAIGRPFLCSAPFPASCFLMCHCEERSDVAISQYTIWITGRPRRKRKRLLEIATAPSRPRNDKLGSLMPMNLRCMICKCTRRSLSAATDAIGVYHFNGSQYESGVHCRERHAAPLQGVCGRQSAAAFPSAIRYDYAKRTAGRPSSALFTASILPGPPAYCRYRGRNAHAARRLSPSGPSGRPCRGAAQRGPCRPRRHPAPRRGWHSAS